MKPKLSEEAVVKFLIFPDLMGEVYIVLILKKGELHFYRLRKMNKPELKR